jgi:hypothetical protein
MLPSADVRPARRDDWLSERRVAEIEVQQDGCKVCSPVAGAIFGQNDL